MVEITRDESRKCQLPVDRGTARYGRWTNTFSGFENVGFAYWIKIDEVAMKFSALKFRFVLFIERPKRFDAQLIYHWFAVIYEVSLKIMGFD